MLGLSTLKNMTKSTGIIGRAMSPAAGSPADMVTLAAENADMSATLSADVTVSDMLWGADTKGLANVTRWCKLYPYQLLIVEINEGVSGGYMPTPYRFTLPMTPQELTIQVPFAITNTITADGVAEEHNGVKTKNITLAGSLGMAPLRGHAPVSQLAGGDPGILNSIFGGTINAFKNMVSSATALFSGSASTGFKNQIGEFAQEDSSLTGMATQAVLQKENTADTYYTTGYAQYIFLKNFLEGYATMKAKSPDGKNYRLVFAIWKENATYLVTPVSYTLKRSASSPGEYQYELQLKAWKQVKLGLVENPFKELGSMLGLDGKGGGLSVQSILKKIQQARAVIANARATVAAFRGDTMRVFNALREVTLGIKEMVGVARSIIDLPGAIIQDFKDQVWNEVQNTYRDISHLTDYASKDFNAIKNSVAVGASGAGMLKMFERPEEHYDFFESILVDDLNLTPEKQAKVEKEVERVNSFTRSDYEARRDIINDYMVRFADAVGAGDPAFNEALGIPTVTIDRFPTEEEFAVLYALNDVVSEVNKIIALKQEADAEIVRSIEYVAGLASGAGVAFNQPVSKFAVPFPHGATLERLSQMYLGDPNRWHEIATLNGLREPYIDEDGFEYSLVANGSGNQVSVAHSQDLYINQPVWLSGIGVVRTKRRILAITENPGIVTLTLDGESDLNRYTVANSAKLHAYLPDTINSEMMIYIPSNADPMDSDTTDLEIPGVDQFDQLLNIAGTDLLLTQDGDLVISNDGDARIAYGLNHLVQRVRLVLGTPRGSLLQHPHYGLSLQVGKSLADMAPGELANATKDLFNEDPAFNHINSVSVAVNGPSIAVALGLDVVGLDQPISVAVQTFK